MLKIKKKIYWNNSPRFKFNLLTECFKESEENKVPSSDIPLGGETSKW